MEERLMNRTHHYLHLRAARGFGRYALLVGCVLYASLGSASTISFSFSGTSTAAHPITGMADFTLSPGSATIKLTNTTVKTFASDELLTGLDFTLAGLTPTISSKSGIERT